MRRKNCPWLTVKRKPEEGGLKKQLKIMLSNPGKVRPMSICMITMKITGF
jgi:hypothetical protein